MLELIITVIALWLLIKAIGLALKITWGTTKIVASILITLAVIELLIKEIEIIKPKYIVLCDKYFDKLSMEYINENMNPDCCPALVECLQNRRLITMPHPSSRMKLKKMFSLLEEQL